MTINSYDIPSGVVLRVEFRDQNGNLIDPTSVTCQVADPAGAKSRYSLDDSVTYESVGIYTCTIIGNQTGRWNWIWTGIVNGIPVTKEGYFLMKGTAFGG